jgi:hypothetical protein
VQRATPPFVGLPTPRAARHETSNRAALRRCHGGRVPTLSKLKEIIRRPLYREHSGQWGLSVAALETALKGVLTRAQRWGAVMVIDEAIVSRCIALTKFTAKFCNHKAVPPMLAVFKRCSVFRGMNVAHLRVAP